MNVIPLLIQNMLNVSSFFSALVGVAAAVVMFSVVRKFGRGVVADGFRHVMIGVFFVAGAMFIDAFVRYYEWYPETGRIIKEVLLVIGMYTIVIGAKTTADKLEQLQKPKE